MTWPLSRQAVVASVLVTSVPMLGDYFTERPAGAGHVDDRQPDQQLGAHAGQTGQAGAFVLLILLVSIVPMVVYVRYTRSAEDIAS